MGKEINIGIYGTSWNNKGAETMIYVIVDQFSRKAAKDNRSAHFKIFLDAKYDSIGQSIKFPTNTENIFWQPGKVQFIKDFILVFLYRITKRNFLISSSFNLKKMNECDFLIGADGYCFYDSNGIKAILFSLSRILFCSFLGKKYYLFPQSFGPFYSKSRILLLKLMLGRATQIYVRGNESQETLYKVIKKESVICPDIAFLFDIPTEFYQKKYIKNSGGPSQKIGIIPNVNLAKVRKEYIQLLINFLKKISYYDYKIFLIPHEIKKNKFDDLAVCQQIYQGLVDKEREKVVVIDDKNYTANDYKAIIGKMDFVVASRFHSAVAALSQTIPVITLSWSFKYKELMSWFGLKDYNIDFIDFDTQKVIDLVRRVEANKNDLKADILTKLPTIRQTLEKLFQDTYNENR